MKLYDELADWWPIFSEPEHYAEETGVYAATIFGQATQPVRRVLELGSGGGNNASHLKLHFDLTLVDLSPRMLAVSRELNPECEHIEGDMRNVRLGRAFDAVLIHDAIAYMTTRDDLAAAITTAAEHLTPRGLALFVPDDTVETYQPDTDHGGEDDEDDGRGIRFLQWSQEPVGNTYEVHFAYMLREGDRTRLDGETHRFGLFDQATWVELIEGAGLSPRVLPYPHSSFDREHVLFVGVKS